MDTEKSNKVYVAINNPESGDSFGKLISEENESGVRQLHDKFKQAHDLVNKWIQSVEGSIVVEMHGEAIYLIPSSKIDDLSSLKGAYTDLSGGSLFIGVGNTMSEAAKAMMYGHHMNYHDVVHYESSIDDSLSDKLSPDDTPEDESAETLGNDTESAIDRDSKNIEDLANDQMDDQEMEQLSQRIAKALEAFNDNRDFLNQLKTSNEELYYALLLMIDSMVAMGKEIGFKEPDEYSQLPHANDINQTPSEDQGQAQQEGGQEPSGGIEPEKK